MKSFFTLCFFCWLVQVVPAQNSPDLLCAYLLDGQPVALTTWEIADYNTGQTIASLSGNCLSVNDLLTNYPHNAVVYPVRNQDPVNGTTVLDIYKMSRHILGLEPLPTPIQMLAADINRSNSITTFDFVELKKLILGIYTEFPNNATWRTIRTDYTFTNPFVDPGPSQIFIGELDSLDVDYMIVHVGDVNNSVSPALPPVIPSPTACINIRLQDVTVPPGDTATIAVYIETPIPLIAWQYGLHFDSLTITDVSIPNNSHIENIGLFSSDITALDVQPSQFLDVNGPVMWIQVQSNATLPIKAAEEFTLSNKIRSVAYDQTEKEYCFIPTKLVGTPPVVGTESAILVFPNPAHDLLTIQNQQATEFSITLAELYNAQGQLQRTLQFTGSTAATLSVGDLPVGLYWLHVNNEGNSQTVKVWVD